LALEEQIMMKSLKILAAALLCQALVASPGWCVEVGEPMPDFGIKTLTGEVISRTSLAGKPLMLLFWNTWCPNCKKELPQANLLAGKYANKGLKVLAVNTGLNDSENKAKAYWKKSGYSFPSAFDRYFDMGESFGIQGVPTVVLVDAWGKVRYKSSQLPENMEDQMKQLYIR
jgi:thiol-disulfide isomerase/thioredoxin